MTKPPVKIWLWLSFLGYWLALATYAIFSYALTAPNLVLSQNRYFWHFQTWMWNTFFNHRELLTKVYLTLILTNFGLYVMFASQLLKSALKFKTIFLALLMLVFPLILSNNALSYDAFNYIFNAKMLAVYQVDPHVRVATDFPDDPWLKFMHNITTTAPYGHGWTYLSLIPFALGLGKFLTTWLSFRLFSLLPLLLLAYLYWHSGRQNQPAWLVLVIFNPLLLIEVVSNMHNDLWMTVPAIWSLHLLIQTPSRRNRGLRSGASLLALAGSIWVKLASVTLLPLWFLMAIKDRLKGIPRLYALIEDWPLLASLTMFVPLLTARSQQFHPWYLIWPLTFVPLIKPNRWNKIWVNSLVVLSASSLLRYLPFLWNNHYDAQILLWQRLITFVPFVVALIYFGKQAVFDHQRQ